MCAHKQEKIEPFKVLPEYMKELTLDEAKFYMELAEKQLDDSIDTGKTITERAINLFSLTTGILIALIAFCITRYEEKQTTDALINMSLWGCGFLFIASCLLIFAFTPKPYFIPGANPAVVFDKKLFNGKRTSDGRQKNMMISLINDYKNSTDENIERNTERWKLFKYSVFVMLLSPLLFACYYLLFR